MGVLAEKMGALNASTAVLSATADAFNRDALTPAISSFTLLVGALGPGGNVTTSCSEIEAALDTAAGMPGKVTAAGAVFTGGQIFEDLVTRLNDTARLACSSAQALLPGATQALTGVTEEAKAVSDIIEAAESLFALGTTSGEQSSLLLSTQRKLAEAMRRGWDWLANRVIGLLPYAVPLLLGVVALLGALCMRTARRTGSRANRCGVQLSGCSWVGISLYAVVLLLLGSALLGCVVILLDFGTILEQLKDPATILGEARCNAPWNERDPPPGTMVGATLYLYGPRTSNGEANVLGQLPLCDVVEGCFQDPSVSALNDVEKALDVEGFFDISRFDGPLGLIRDALGMLPADDLAAAVAAAQDALLAVGKVDAASLCEGGCSQQLAAELAADLEAIAAGVGRAIAGLTDAYTLLSDALDAAERLLSAIEGLLGAIRGFLASLECDWLYQAYFGPVRPLRGEVLGGLEAMAISMVACGVLGAVAFGWIITMQVYCGGVGKQPGCPRPCRCCCPAPKKDYPSRISAEVEVIDSTIIVI